MRSSWHEEAKHTGDVKHFKADPRLLLEVAHVTSHGRMTRSLGLLCQAPGKASAVGRAASSLQVKTHPGNLATRGYRRANEQLEDLYYDKFSALKPAQALNGDPHAPHSRAGRTRGFVQILRLLHRHMLPRANR